MLKIKLAENVSANDEQSERIIDLESKIKSLEYNNDTCELKTYMLLEIPFKLFYNYWVLSKWQVFFGKNLCDVLKRFTLLCLEFGQIRHVYFSKSIITILKEVYFLRVFKDI